MIFKKNNSKKKNVYMRNQYYYHFDLPKNGVGWAHTTKNLVVFALFIKNKLLNNHLPIPEFLKKKSGETDSYSSRHATTWSSYNSLKQINMESSL